MVQRYNYYTREPDDVGVFVEYEDYVKLEAELQKYKDYVKLEAELQKYKDQFPDYVECANCGSITHVEGVE